MRRLMAILSCVVIASPVFAQPDSPPKAEKLIVATLSVQRAMLESPPGKAFLQDTQKYADKKQAEILARVEEINKLQKDLQTKEKEKTLKPDEKETMTKRLVELDAEATRIQEEANKMIRKLEENAFSQLRIEVDRVVKEVAKEQGVQLVVDNSGQAGAHRIILLDSKVRLPDITDLVLKRLESVKLKPPEEAADIKPEPGDTETKPRVVFETSAGNIVFELDREKAPATVNNFLKYVTDKHFDGTMFHRVIKDFVIQGGGMTPDLNEKPTRPPIKNEAKNGLKNLKGTLSMARTGDPDSATSQFFINLVDNSRLDHKDEEQYGYAVFGKVAEGMDVVEKIRNGKTETRKGFDDVPVEPVVVKSARRLPAGQK